MLGVFEEQQRSLVWLGPDAAGVEPEKASVKEYEVGE